MEKIKKLYENLTEEKKNLLELFDEEKKDLIELIEGANYERIYNLSSYNKYTKIISTIQRINEIDIKLRTLRYLSKTE